MTTKTNAAQAAAQIRAKLKAEGVTARVTSKNYAGGCSISITLADPLPATRKAVETFAHQYQYGSFDGMTDCYNVDNRRDDIPQVSYVFVSADYSDELRQAAWDWALTRLAGMEDAPADAKAAGSFRNTQFSAYGDDLLYRVLNGAYKGFWFTRKPRVTCAA